MGCAAVEAGSTAINANRDTRRRRGWALGTEDADGTEVVSGVGAIQTLGTFSTVEAFPGGEFATTAQLSFVA
jgi:hypothetical protein